MLQAIKQLSSAVDGYQYSMARTSQRLWDSSWHEILKRGPSYLAELVGENVNEAAYVCAAKDGFPTAWRSAEDWNGQGPRMMYNSQVWEGAIDGINTASSFRVCGKETYTLLQRDRQTGGGAASDASYGDSDSPLLRLPAELRYQIWRLCLPQYQSPWIFCEGDSKYMDVNYDKEKCPATDDFTLLQVSRQMRTEIAPLLGIENIQNVVFQFCTKACARRYMDEVACFKGLGVRKAVVEMINTDFMGVRTCGTPQAIAGSCVRWGRSHPFYTFQVTFT